MTSYRFVFDNDSRKASAFFPPGRVVTLEKAGLTEKASDREIVEAASDRKWIIVTANGDDFIAEIKLYLRQSMKLVCHDLSGLVIVPYDHQLQKRVLPGLEEKLHFGGKHISWKDVWDLDCCVRVTRDGKPHITRFERCCYCKRNGVS
jgi:predicted nuclease of predicted toxin-antitoxin system